MLDINQLETVEGEPYGDNFVPVVPVDYELHTLKTVLF